MLFKGIHRLPNQRHAVGQKQYPLGPIATHQQISKGNDGSGLARTRRHYYQGLALVVHLERFGYPTHGTGLIIAFDDVGVDNGIRQRFMTGAALNQQFQFLFFIKALDSARRITGIVPEPVFIAIGIKNHRTLAILSFQAVGIKFGLLLADLGILTGALGFNQRQRLAVIAPQHIVDIAFPFGSAQGKPFNSAFGNSQYQNRVGSEYRRFQNRVG